MQLINKTLTEMQKTFSRIYVENHYGNSTLTNTQVAMKAGYSPDSAYQRAYELLNPRICPHVVKYIGEIREEHQKKYAITFERHISELGKLRDNATKKGAHSAAINAEVARGKAAGLYIEQKIIRTGKLDDLSAEELETRLKTILNEYSPILEGVEVDDLKEKVKKLTPHSNLKN